MLGKKIKALRCEKGLSQEELGDKLSVVRQTISKWEKGLSVPDSDMLVRIAEVLDTNVSQLVCEQIQNPINEKSKTNKPNVISIILIILGFPVWFSLCIALFFVIVALYAVLWCAVISLWAVFASLIACALGGLVAFAIFAANGNSLSGVAMLAASIICAGLSIFVFFGAKAAIKGTLLLTKKLVIYIKNYFAKKEAAS